MPGRRQTPPANPHLCPSVPVGNGPCFPKPFWVVLHVPNSQSAGFLRKDKTFHSHQGLLRFDRMTLWSFLEVRGNCVRTEPGSLTAGRHLFLLIWQLRHLVPGWGTTKAAPSSRIPPAVAKLKQSLWQFLFTTLRLTLPHGAVLAPQGRRGSESASPGPGARDGARWMAWAVCAWSLGQNHREQIKVPVSQSRQNGGGFFLKLEFKH